MERGNKTKKTVTDINSDISENPPAIAPKVKKRQERVEIITIVSKHPLD